MSLYEAYLLYIVKCKWNTLILYEALQKLYSITVQCLLLNYISLLSTKSPNDWGHSCSLNIWLHPLIGHCQPIIENVVYMCGSYLIRNAHMSSVSSAISSALPPTSSATHPHSSSSSSSLLPLTPSNSFSFHCQTLQHCVVLQLYIYIYILSSWSFMRRGFELFQKHGWSLVDLMLNTFPFLKESQDSPVQDGFRKKV